MEPKAGVKTTEFLLGFGTFAVFALVQLGVVPLSEEKYWVAAVTTAVAAAYVIAQYADGRLKLKMFDPLPGEPAPTSRMSPEQLFEELTKLFAEARSKSQTKDGSDANGNQAEGPPA